MLNVRVALVGPGAIGSAFLRQLAESVQTGLGATLKASIKLVAVANSKTMVACSGDDLLLGWKEELQLVRNSRTDLGFCCAEMCLCPFYLEARTPTHVNALHHLAHVILRKKRQTKHVVPTICSLWICGLSLPQHTLMTEHTLVCCCLNIHGAVFGY